MCIRDLFDERVSVVQSALELPIGKAAVYPEGVTWVIEWYRLPMSL